MGFRDRDTLARDLLRFAGLLYQGAGALHRRLRGAFCMAWDEICFFSDESLCAQVCVRRRIYPAEDGGGAANLGRVFLHFLSHAI